MYFGTIDLGDFVSLASATSEEDFLARAQRAARTIGFERALFGIEWRPASLPPIQHISSGWPAEYQRLYWERGLIAVDPTVPHCQTSADPLVWTPDMYRTPASFEVLEESRRFGLEHGLSVPMHESSRVVSMMSFARDKPLESEAERQLVVAASTMIAQSAHMVAKRVMFPDLTQSVRSQLTPRELECLKWLAQGKSNSVIGTILNLSDHGVEFHVRRLMKKLNVSTRVQAAIVAVEMGVV